MQIVGSIHSSYSVDTEMQCLCLFLTLLELLQGRHSKPLVACHDLCRQADALPGIKNALMGDIVQHSDFTLNMFPPEESAAQTRRVSDLHQKSLECGWPRLEHSLSCVWRRSMPWPRLPSQPEGRLTFCVCPTCLYAAG